MRKHWRGPKAGREERRILQKKTHPEVLGVGFYFLHRKKTEILESSLLLLPRMTLDYGSERRNFLYTIHMTRKQVIDGFLQKAAHDKQTATDLFRLEHFDWCLFVWHLAIEKLLKALILKENKEILYIHDLVRLAKITNLPQTEDVLDSLREITTFNIETRYDDYKLSFYHKANKEYTQKWMQICEKLYHTISKNIHEIS